MSTKPSIKFKKSQQENTRHQAAAPPAMELKDLPDELLLKVLARVPAITSNFPAMEATTLKAVCRGWNSLVSCPEYIRHFISLGEENNCPWENGEAVLFTFSSWVSHWLNNNVPQKFYMLPAQCDTDAAVQPAAIDFSYISEDPSHHCILHASEDLLLLTGRPYETGSLIVCNPFTKKWVTLPYLPRLPCEFFKLVYDSQSNRYSVVSFNYLHIECIFTSETGQWQKVQSKEIIERVLGNVLPFNGSLYWYSYCHNLVAYNPFVHEYRKFPDPFPGEQDYRQYHLAVVHGSLRMYKFTDCGVERKRRFFYDLVVVELDFKEKRWSLIYESPFRVRNSWKRRPIYRLVAVHPYGNIVYFRKDDHLHMEFLDLSKKCYNFSKVSFKDEPEGMLHWHDTLIINRPWQPSSVDYNRSEAATTTTAEEATTNTNGGGS